MPALAFASANLYALYPGEVDACSNPAAVGEWSAYRIPGDYYSDPERKNFPHDAHYRWQASEMRASLRLYDYLEIDTLPDLLLHRMSTEAAIVAPRTWRDTWLTWEEVVAPTDERYQTRVVMQAVGIR